MRVYADTNFFSRLYLRLPESHEALDLLEQAKQEASPPLPVSWLHRVELINAFQLHVFTGKLGGQTRITTEQASAAQAAFWTDVAQATFLRPVQIDFAELQSQFEELALRYTAKQGFRTYDLLHVATALLLLCDTFWSFDPKASRLASLEGLLVR
jgi:predicted nucleic acid-binding protein